MKRVFLLAMTLVLSTGLLLAAAKSKSWTGTVSDAMCGKKHGMMAGASDKDCTIKCVKGGSKYALVVGNKVYTLDGNTSGLEQFAGARAKVSGTLKGDTITVESASAVPAGKAKAKGTKKS